MVESLDQETVRLYANSLYSGINDEAWLKQQITRHSHPLGEMDDPERFDKIPFWEEGIDPKTGEFTNDQWITGMGVSGNWQVRILDNINDPQYIADTVLDETADEMVRLLGLKKLASYRGLSGSEELAESGLNGDELSAKAEAFLSGLAQGDIGMIYPVRVEDQPTRWSDGMPQP
ncbi:MAG: hypothetical protein Q7R40_06420 [Phaeospirillum sp.]|nr:hypothetical protein [Phaeospirillum sp.]